MKYKYKVNNETFEFEMDYDYPHPLGVAIDAAEDYYHKGDEYINGSHYHEEWPIKLELWERWVVAGKWYSLGCFELEVFIKQEEKSGVSNIGLMQGDCLERMKERGEGNI